MKRRGLLAAVLGVPFAPRLGSPLLVPDDEILLPAWLRKLPYYKAIKCDVSYDGHDRAVMHTMWENSDGSVGSSVVVLPVTHVPAPPKITTDRTFRVPRLVFPT
jgi:hypothetical protein